jgi:Holliday junction resolvase
MPREASIVASIVRAAKESGWWVMKIHGGPHQLAGVPDLLCLRQGRAVFLEVKQPGKKATPLQAARMNEIETQGGAVCHVVTSRAEAEAALATREGP